MSLWHTIKTWLGKEKHELDDLKRSVELSIDSDLSRREKRLDESPIEAMDRLKSEIAEQSQTIGELSAEIEGRSAKWQNDSP